MAARSWPRPSPSPISISCSSYRLFHAGADDLSPCSTPGRWPSRSSSTSSCRSSFFSCTGSGAAASAAGAAGGHASPSLAFSERECVQAAALFLHASSRAWELLLGTLIASELSARRRTPLWRNAGSLPGSSLILVPGRGLTKRRRSFPAMHALAPCLGAALIIAAGRSGDSFVARRAFLARPWSSSAASPIRSISGTGRSSSS